LRVQTLYNALRKAGSLEWVQKLKIVPVLRVPSSLKLYILFSQACFNIIFPNTPKWPNFPHTFMFPSKVLDVWVNARTGPREAYV